MFGFDFEFDCVVSGSLLLLYFLTILSRDFSGCAAEMWVGSWKKYCLQIGHSSFLLFGFFGWSEVISRDCELSFIVGLAFFVFGGSGHGMFL